MPPPSNDTVVALTTGTLGPPLDDIARHPWFAVRRKGETEWRDLRGAEQRRRARPVPRALPATGSRSCTRSGGARRPTGPRRASSARRDRGTIGLKYRFYPGPNSNTFGDVMLRKCSLHASLPSTAVGKDWRGTFGAGVTSEGTGVQVETPGPRASSSGSRRAWRLHVLGLSIGIDLLAARDHRAARPRPAGDRRPMRGGGSCTGAARRRRWLRRGGLVVGAAGGRRAPAVAPRDGSRSRAARGCTTS